LGDGDRCQFSQLLAAATALQEFETNAARKQQHSRISGHCDGLHQTRTAPGVEVVDRLEAGKHQLKLEPVQLPRLQPGKPCGTDSGDIHVNEFRHGVSSA